MSFENGRMNGRKDVTVHILSRHTMLDALASDPELPSRTNVISIHGWESEPVFRKSHPRVLTLRFDDVEWAVDYDTVLFSKQQAGQVLDFLESIQDGEELIVHCFAGISRSGAVGLFASHYYGQDVHGLLARFPQVNPNRLVLRLLLEAHERRLQQQAPATPAPAGNSPELSVAESSVEYLLGAVDQMRMNAIRYFKIDD